nr:hotdog domain-containing protein [Radiobacillus deserti]
MKALQHIQRQPQVGETIEDIATSRIEVVQDEAHGTVYQAQVTPQMTNQLGSLSYGVFTSFVTEASSRLLRQFKKGNLVVENLTIYFIKPVQLDSRLEIRPRLLEVSRKFAKVDVEVYNEKIMVGKALLMAQLMDR